jgi:hypothetical protein
MNIYEIEKMVQYQLIFINTNGSNKTIGIYTDINELFKAAHAHPGHETEYEIHEINVESETTPDKLYQFTWNKCALWNKDYRMVSNITYVAEGYKHAFETITRINDLKEIVENKQRMVKSLMNLDAKNTKAPISMATLLSSFVSVSTGGTPSKPMDTETFYAKKKAELEKLQYLNALLDDWISDLIAQTGYEGLRCDLVCMNQWNRKTEAITFP